MIIEHAIYVANNRMARTHVYLYNILYKDLLPVVNSLKTDRQTFVLPHIWDVSQDLDGVDGIPK